jgi:DNA-binding transcriptional LysR family regulator
MNNFDHFDLDGRLLRALVVVHEEGSVTRAAQRLGVTQSAVSHMLDKLREIVGDPLFVKSGRSVVATAQAGELAGRARLLLDQLQEFGNKSHFNPAEIKATLTIAANDLQRDLLLPTLLARLRESAPDLRLRVIPSNIPGAEMLRADRCQLAISPRPPEGADILQRRLFDDRYVIFFDQAVRSAPASLADYLAAEHVTVVYEPQRKLDIDDHLAQRGIERRFAVSVAGFAGIRSFLAGSNYLATLPRRLGAHQLAGFSQAETPFACPTMPMYAIWHKRYQHDALMRWVLEALYDITSKLGRENV